MSTATLSRRGKVREVEDWETGSVNEFLVAVDVKPEIGEVVAVEGEAVPRDEFAQRQVPKGATVTVDEGIAGG